MVTVMAAAALQSLPMDSGARFVDDSFDDVDAGVICKQLGYTGGEATPKAMFPPGKGRVSSQQPGLLLAMSRM